jgi:hypothetical protein
MLLVFTLLSFCDLDPFQENARNGLIRWNTWRFSIWKFDVCETVISRFYVKITILDLKIREMAHGSCLRLPRRKIRKITWLIWVMYAEIKAPLLIRGDFYLLRFPYKNKIMRNNKWHDMFNSVINTYEPRELDMSGVQHTWCNNQVVPTSARFLVTTIKISPDCKLHTIISYVTHCFLFLTHIIIILRHWCSQKSL